MRFPSKRPLEARPSPTGSPSEFGRQGEGTPGPGPIRGVGRSGGRGDPAPVLGWNLLSTKGDLRTLRAQLTALQADSAQSRAEQAKLEEVLRFLSDPLVRTVKLSGLKPSPRATARLLWKAETRKGYFLTAELPRVPEGKTYALWAIAGKKPVPFA